MEPEVTAGAVEEAIPVAEESAVEVEESVEEAPE